MRIVLLGPPGSGKGTQAKRIAAHYRIPHVTVSGALADIAADDSELGRLVKETIEANRVSDDLTIAVLRVRLTQADAANGFVLDGFPRTVSQAETLETVLDGIGRPLDVVLLVDVDPDELMERLVGRLTCEGCGTIYNAYANPPTVEGVCDRCGGRVSRLPDDYEETISNRLRIFESQTAQVIDHFKLRGKLRRVSGEGGAEEVFGQIRHIVDSTPRTVIEMEPVSEAAEPLPASLPPTPTASARQKPAQKGKARAKATAAETVAAFKKVAAEVAAEKATGRKTAAKLAAPTKPATPVARKKEAAKPSARKAVAPAAKAPSAKTPAQVERKAATKAPATPPVGKVPAKKGAAKAAAPIKPVTKKPAPKKAAPGKAATKAGPAKAAPKKAAPKKAGAKKAAPKKAGAKKAAPKKAGAKKAAPKKAGAKKAAPKPVAKKPATRPSPAKGPGAKKAPAKKKPAKASARKG